MSTTTPTTAEQLLAMPDDGLRYELVEGELRMMSPSGWRHGEIVGELHGLLWHHIRQSKAGKVLGAETGFLVAREPDTVRAPDIAFIAASRSQGEPPSEAFWPGAPDLAVEVLSPGDKTGEVNEKITTWLAAGCQSVWVVDPKLQTVTIYHSLSDIRVVTAGQTLEDEIILPGFSTPAAALFPKQ